MGSNMIAKAYHLAKDKHKGQRYGDKDYFDYHLEGVYDLCKIKLRNIGVEALSDLGITVLSVAYLHDILEDTDTTIDEVRYQFGNIVADAVLVLTKSESDSYIEYLTKVKENTIALTVKICDIEFNYKNTINDLSSSITSDRAYRLKDKYDKANKFLGVVSKY